MCGKKTLVEVNRAVVVRRVPVEVRAVLGVKDGVVRLLAVGIQCERLTREGRGEVVVFPCALAVKLCEQQRRARARFLLAALFLQKALLFVKFLLCEKALVPEHIVDAGKAVLVREGEERVDARSQRDGQRGQKLNIGKRAAVFPLAHGLRAHVEGFCKLLLRHAFGEAQRFDLAADVDVHKGKTPFL
jgi:hypothetical protein